MDAGDIGIGRLGANSIFSGAISSELSKGNPSTKNLRAIVAVIDAIFGFEKSFFGPDAANQRAVIEIFKQYRSAATSAMSLKKHKRRDFLIQRNVQIIKSLIGKYDGLLKSGMAEMDNEKRAAMQSVFDSVVGKKEKPKLRVIR